MDIESSYASMNGHFGAGDFDPVNLELKDLSLYVAMFNILLFSVS